VPTRVVHREKKCESHIARCRPLFNVAMRRARQEKASSSNERHRVLHELAVLRCYMAAVPARLAT